MHFLVLQHSAIEHLGKFREFLTEDGHSWDAILLDDGAVLPDDLRVYDGLWVLGGAMDVWQEQEFPWLVAEKAFIKRAVVEQGLPFLGFCLGHQLLAEVLGGSVGRAKSPEIGVMEVQITEDGAEDVLLDGVPLAFKCLQWHGSEITALPSDVKVLATSPACVVQAMGWQNRAYSVQFHLEIEKDTLKNWCASDPAYEDALHQAIGKDAAERMLADAAANQSAFETIAERVYINWLQAIAHVR